MSPFDSLSRVGTLVLLGIIGGLVAFLLLRLLSWPLLLLLAVVDGLMKRLASWLAVLVQPPSEPRGTWGDRWGEAIPTTRAPA
ncbi:hypothetical protein [Amycolatopsis sp. NPDC102389]|uniref:hypothetical protein n=1 Tax=Amycolatopsis sp. NPDC102389 TaxID=3363941 RepID=UPI0038003FE3